MRKRFSAVCVVTAGLLVNACTMVLAMKLFFLAVRQVSKPIAGFARQRALNSENVRGFLAFVGRGLHRMDLQITRIAAGKEPLASVTKLPEERAVVRGSELVSESVIYGIAGYAAATSCFSSPSQPHNSLTTHASCWLCLSCLQLNCVL